MHHKLEDQERICLSVVHELEYGLCSLEYLWQHLVVEISPVLLELRLGQVAEVVVGLSDEFFRVKESVDEEPAA